MNRNFSYTLCFFAIALITSVVFISSCSVNRPSSQAPINLSKVQWALDINRLYSSDIRALVFLVQDNPDIWKCTEEGRITDTEKIEEIWEALVLAEQEPVGGCAWSIRMAVVTKDNRGIVFEIGWDHDSKKVGFRQGIIEYSSKQLFQVFLKHGLILPYIEQPKPHPYPLPKSYEELSKKLRKKEPNNP